MIPSTVANTPPVFARSSSHAHSASGCNGTDHDRLFAQEAAKAAVAISRSPQARAAECGLFGPGADTAHRIEVVDPHPACIDAAADLDRLGFFPDDRRGQAEFGIVGKPYGFLHGVEGHDRHDRPK